MDPATLGSALARYRDARGWTRDQVANWLGVTVDGLAALALTPGTPMEPGEPYEALARRYGADPGRLAEALQ